MTDKEQQSKRRQAEDAAFHRMLLWLLVAVVAELVVLLVKYFYVDITGAAWRVSVAQGLLLFFRVYRFLGIALAAAAAVWAVQAARRGKGVLRSRILTGAAIFLLAVSWVAYHFYDEGVRVLLVLPAIGAGLILVYFLYQRSFFVNTVLTGGGIAALWLHRAYYPSHPGAVVGCFLVVWMVLAGAAALCWRLRQSGGVLGGRRLMPVRSHYVSTWVTCGIVAAALAVGLVLGTSAALYLIFGLIGWLFCQAVFFTVKLM
ncbi:MAG TPA: hypothetical protein IAC84_06620 [Firmicutes bacterium]|nr:hypothetical protein [Bacillota bacterium]